MMERGEHALTSGETRRALRRLIEVGETMDRLTLGQMLETLGRSGHGLVLLVLALPSFIPIPGLPTGLIFGTALILVASQIMRGHEQLSLPRWLARWSLPSHALLSVVRRLDGWMERLERLLRPRLTALTEGLAMTIVAGLVIVMGVTLLLPIPTGNTGPAVAVVVFAFGIMERDGVAIIAGVLLSVLGFAWNVALIAFGAAITSWLWAAF